MTSFDEQKIDDALVSWSDISASGEYCTPRLVRAISQVLNTATDYVELEQLRDMLSVGQIFSKVWIITTLNEIGIRSAELGEYVYIVGGWYGSLAFMLDQYTDDGNTKFRSFDIDPRCAKVAEALNQTALEDDWKFKATTMDMYDIDYREHRYVTFDDVGKPISMYEVPSTIINTSCEHIKDFAKWWDMIPDGKLVILQNNDFFELDEHINCVDSLKEFAMQTPLRTVLSSTAVALEDYTRYMRIGYK